MRTVVQGSIAVAALAASAYVLVNIPESMRLVERFKHPAPELHKRAAWKELQQRGLSPGMPVFLRIFKQSSELEVWLREERGWTLFRTVEICRWSGKLGPKLKEGDRQSPEGFYRVRRGHLNPNSRHHLSFNLGFPNRFDRSHGRTGSFLMVHGGCSSIGCYAVGDHEVEVVYRLVEAALENGQSVVNVHAFPFRMSDARLAAYAGHRWHDFWRMLKPAYDAFERAREVPQIKTAGRRYVVN